MVSKSEDVLFDFEFVNKFSTVLRAYIKEDYQFGVILGGGYLMRKYRDMAKAGGIEEDLQLHWIGTTCNVLNAEVVRACMHDIANERIVAYEDYYDESKELKFEEGKSVIVGGGGRAGHSGDLDALMLSKRLNIDTIISLKNVDAVYTADPKKDKNAKRLDNITWDEYFKVINYETEHAPGANYPIDPVTSKQAKELKRKFIIISGDNFDNLEKVLKGKEFLGTVVG